MAKEQKNNQIAKHTPGEWLVYNGTDVFADEIQVADCNFKHFVVSKDLEEGERPFTEAKANALLISAAKNMLEALLKVQKDLEQWSLPPSTEKLINQAITKATGGNL